MTETSISIKPTNAEIHHLNFRTEDPEGDARLACDVKVHFPAVPAEILECFLVGNAIHEHDDNSPRWMPVETLYAPDGTPKFLGLKELKFRDVKFRPHVCKIGKVSFSEAKIGKATIEIRDEFKIGFTVSIAVYPDDETCLTRYLNKPVSVSVDPKKGDMFPLGAEREKSNTDERRIVVENIIAMPAREAEKAVARLENIDEVDAVRLADNRAGVKTAADKRVRTLKNIAARKAFNG